MFTFLLIISIVLFIYYVTKNTRGVQMVEETGITFGKIIPMIFLIGFMTFLIWLLPIPESLTKLFYFIESIGVLLYFIRAAHLRRKQVDAAYSRREKLLDAANEKQIENIKNEKVNTQEILNIKNASAPAIVSTKEETAKTMNLFGDETKQINKGE